MRPAVPPWAPALVIGLRLPGLCGAQQVAAVAPATATQPPGAVFSPNPPACAAFVADAVYFTTQLATGIVSSLNLCHRAFNLNFNPSPGGSGAGGGASAGADAGGGGTSGDSGVAAGVGGEAIQSQNPRACAAQIINDISYAAAALERGLGAIFNCFNDNQGCGQASSAAARYLADGAQALTQAAGWCQPLSQEAGNDVPYSGFLCWQKLWHMIQRFVKSSKFIDTALSLCEPVAPLPQAVGPRPVPTSAIAGGSAAAAPAGGSTVAGRLRSDDEAGDLTAARRSWDLLLEPFAVAGEVDPEVRPAQRRLLA